MVPRHIGETIIDKKIDFCGDTIPIDFVCEATEIESFLAADDFGSLTTQKKYKCPSHQIEKTDRKSIR